MTIEPTREDSPGLRFERLHRQLVRLRSIFGVPTYQLTEVQQLERHILERIKSILGDEGTLYPNWVASRFTYPLRELLWQSSRNSRSHVVLNMIVVAGGFATSGIAAASAGKKETALPWVVFGIGLLVAVAGGSANCSGLGIEQPSELG
jgi:hypothetical protein